MTTEMIYDKEGIEFWIENIEEYLRQTTNEGKAVEGLSTEGIVAVSKHLMEQLITLQRESLVGSYVELNGRKGYIEDLSVPHRTKFIVEFFDNIGTGEVVDPNNPNLKILEE